MKELRCTWRVPNRNSFPILTLSSPTWLFVGARLPVPSWSFATLGLCVIYNAWLHPDAVHGETKPVDQES